MIEEGYSPIVSSVGELQRAPAPPQDLDRFLVGCYRHFDNGGMQGVISKTVSSLMTVAFVIGFSFVLLGLVDWNAVLTECQSEESCAQISIFGGWQWTSLWHLVVLAYFLVFLFYLGLQTVNTVTTVTEATALDAFFRLRLGITSDSELRAEAWEGVLQRLSDAQAEGPSFCIVQERLSVVEITGIVQREDHFLILLVSVVREQFQSAPLTGLDSWLLLKCAKYGVFSSAVIWSLRMLISSSLLDDRARLRRELLVNNGKGLARVFQFFGIIFSILFIPLLLFSVLYFFLRDAEDLRSSRLSPSQRQWTVQAQWTLREYGETPQALTARLEAAAPSVEAFLALGGEWIGHPVSFQTKKFLKFIAGSFAAVILVIALYHEQALFHIHLFGRNLVWYLGVFGAIIALTATPTNLQSRPSSVFKLDRDSAAKAAEEVAEVLHQLPSLARFRSSSVFVEPGSRAEFCEQFSYCADEISNQLYASRASVLITDILGVILGPIIIGVWLPTIAPLLAERLSIQTAHSPNLGDWPAAAALVTTQGGEMMAFGDGRRAVLLRDPMAARAAVLGAQRFGKDISPDGSLLIDEFGETTIYTALEKNRPPPASLLSHPYLNLVESI